MVKNVPAMWETPVQSLGGEDSLERRMVTHSSVLAWRIPQTKEPGGPQSRAAVHGVTKSLTGLSNFHFHL